MMHDITVQVSDTHYTRNGVDATEQSITVGNAIDAIDVYMDALRNVSLLYTYDLSCGYYVDRLVISTYEAYMLCKSYTDPRDYHILRIDPIKSHVRADESKES